MKKFIIGIFCLLFFSVKAQVLIQSNATFNASSFSYAPGSGYNRAVVFFISVEFNSTGDALSGLTYGGVAGTLITQTSVTGSGRRDQVAAYRFIETQLASRTDNNVVISFTGTFNSSDGIAIEAYTLVEVNQTTPFEDAATYANASSNSASTSNINADTDDQVIYLCSSSGSTSTWTPGATFTEYKDVTVTGSHRYSVGAVLRTNNGVSSPSATNSSTNRLVMIAFEANFQDAPLPVELLEFSAEKDGRFSLLKWKTATESFNSHFNVYHSVDGQSFQLIGTVQGNGNSQTMKNYALLHHNPAVGINYYRLEQVDYNGDSKVYPEVALNFDKIAALNAWVDYQSYNNILHFDFIGDHVSFELYTLDGKTVLSKILDKNEFAFDLNNTIAPGSYFIRVFNLENTYSRKIIIR
jgi:hypothetical protein